MTTRAENMVNAYAGARSRQDARRISVWLFAVAGLIAAMVIVGGATRLTDSGLSITEWRPVTGAIPPFSGEMWAAEFEKYKAIPEYQEVNFGMSLEQFKVIYWWEWGHRFLGRLIGIVFLAPFVFFLVTKKMSAALAGKLGAIFILGGLQGALGWYMVQSGLSERVDVSQYRLAMHLGLAFILFGYVLWLALELRGTKKFGAPQFVQYSAYTIMAGVFLQIILGAFVAGLRAGRTFNTWPLMDGRFFPTGYFSNEPRFSDLFETIAAVQFNHRLGAYLLFAGAIGFFLLVRKTEIAPRTKIFLGAIVFQIALGIWTVAAATPISLGLLHQAGALLVFGAAIFVAHGAGHQSN